MRPVIQKIVDSIANYNLLDDKDVLEEKTDLRRRFERLSCIATDKELKMLTDNVNGVVRCYSFYALALRKARKTDIFTILYKHLGDSAMIATRSGCTGDDKMVGEYFLDVVTPTYVDWNACKLTSKEKAIVDSYLLFGKKIYLEAKNSLLKRIKPDARNYNRIREIAIEEKNPNALVAWAKFQNKNDIPALKLCFNGVSEYYIAYAIREFPDTVFYPYLTASFEREWSEKYFDFDKWRILIQALAKYPTPETLALFDRIVDDNKEHRNQMLGVCLSIALKKYPNKLFEPIAAKIKLDDYYKRDVKEFFDRDE